MDVLKSLWAMKGYSVGVQKVASSKDVIRVLQATSVDSLNVILLEDEADFNLLMMITREPIARGYSWLVLGDVEPVAEGEFRLSLPIDNLVTFASLHTRNVSDTIVEKVVVTEIYSLAEDLPYITRVLAEWYGRGPLRLPLEGWSERRTNLTGLHLRCVTMPQEPFIYVSEPNDQLKVQLLGGYARDVFKALQEKLGFTYTCRLPPDYKWGSLENGEWNGIMKEMVAGRADVVVTSLDHNSARAKDVDFVTGLRKVGYRMVTRRPGLMDETWTSFTSELLPTAWAGTMAFVILAPPCLVFCSRLSPSETEKVSFKDAYILAIGAFAIQGSWLDVRSLSTRIVFITIFLATLVVYAHYTSALVSLLTVASTSVGFSSLQSLLEDGSYQFGFMSGTSLEDEFRVNTCNTRPYVYMMEENIYRSMFPNQCDTQLLRGQYFTTETGFAVPRGSPLREIFDNQCWIN
ncbi:probable glutamate receptor [Penaeus monodon]|uniref:probable glutamate receptor n=1 Tax=Penaeus monodon TaxID=6687 RepID=UPI0018A7005C|nr:probable glutamate receptor [Penaeus monodon]